MADQDTTRDDSGVTRSTARTARDFRLCADAACAKYDLSMFIEDGDPADERIQRLTAQRQRVERLRESLEGRHGGHPLYHAARQADQALKTIQMVFRAAGATSEERAQASQRQEAASRALEASEAEKKELQQRLDDLGRVLFSDTPDQQPHPVSLEELQRQAGNTGLLPKLEQVNSWLAELGGSQTIEHAVRISQSLEPLLQSIDIKGLKELVDIMEDAGGNTALRQLLAVGKLASPIATELESVGVQRLQELLALANTEDLKGKVLFADKAAPILSMLQNEEVEQLKLLLQNSSVRSLSDKVTKADDAAPLLKLLRGDEIKQLTELLGSKGVSGLKDAQTRAALAEPLLSKVSGSQIASLSQLLRIYKPETLKQFSRTAMALQPLTDVIEKSDIEPMATALKKRKFGDIIGAAADGDAANSLLKDLGGIKNLEQVIAAATAAKELEPEIISSGGIDELKEFVDASLDLLGRASHNSLDEAEAAIQRDGPLSEQAKKLKTDHQESTLRLQGFLDAGYQHLNASLRGAKDHHRFVAPAQAMYDRACAGGPDMLDYIKKVLEDAPQATSDFKDAIKAGLAQVKLCNRYKALVGRAEAKNIALEKQVEALQAALDIAKSKLAESVKNQ